jgi:hypothetical protein
MHSVAYAMDNWTEDECILQVDFSNAFSLTSPQHFINSTYELLPKIGNLTNFLYSTRDLLKLGPNGDNFLFSSTGVQQDVPSRPYYSR